MADRIFSRKIVMLLEGIRKEKNLSVDDFANHFDMTAMSYYRWIRAAKAGAAPNIRLSNVQKGLESLEYDAYIIMTPRK